MANPFDIAKIVNMLDAGYPNWLARKNEQQIELVNEVYFQLLRHFERDLLEAAVTRCMSKPEYRDFAPSAAALRGEVIEILRQAEGIPPALEAWDEVVRMPENFKRYRINGKTPEGVDIVETVILEWSHPIVGNVARMLGFPHFPSVKNGRFENEFGDRAHFFSQYESRVASYLEQKTEHPEVTAFIENQKAAALPAGSAIKQLTEKMERGK
jgi:hypothetical protein